MQIVPNMNPIFYVKEIKRLILGTIFTLCYVLKNFPIIIFENLVFDISFNLQITHLNVWGNIITVSLKISV